MRLYKSISKSTSMRWTFKTRPSLCSNSRRFCFLIDTNKADSFLGEADFKLIRKLTYSFKIELRNKFFANRFNKVFFTYFIENENPATLQKLAKNKEWLMQELEKEINYIQSSI
mmetsp:Transcript_23614/g.27115  ORF Transcript_23614/g.27115 Transcript_23614/m.27115 type:complete len:114 (-) Transcript_23614:15-356(-)